MAEPTFDVISLGPPADGWRAIFSAGSGAAGCAARMLGRIS